MTANVSNDRILSVPYTIGINADSSTIAGSLVTLKNLLDRFLQAGFQAVEIPVHGVGCIVGGRLHPIRVEKVVRLLKQYPFAYTVHGPDPVNLCDPKAPETHCQALQATIDFAKAIEASIVVYHGSYIPKAKVSKFQAGLEKNLWKTEIDRFMTLGDYAEKRGVVIAVENIFRQNGEESYRIDPRRLREVVEKVQSKGVGICFDFGHAYLSANEEGFDYLEAVQAVLPYLVHVHIHDNFGIPAKQEVRHLDALVLGIGDLHLPPGWGSVPYKEVRETVLAGYKGVRMLEIHPSLEEFYEDGLEWVKRGGI
ncbi:MAG: sugar phosphate isomerase/epimerase [Spirochaetales bacterium]